MKEEASPRTVVKISLFASSFRFSIGEFLEDATGQVLVDLTMPGNGLGHSGRGVLIPIMFPTMPNEAASGFLNPFDELVPLHAKTSSASCRTPGI